MADLTKDPKYEAESTGVCMLTKVSGIDTECPAPHAAQAQVEFWDLPVSPLPEARTGFDDAASVHSMDSGVYDTWEHLQEWETLATELAAVGYIPDPENIAALCADRVTQMTKTYNDIDSVTHLLEEKERDLELAARIGQSLLEKNKDLSEQHNDDVQELIDAREKISQLKHDVSMKDALLRIYVQDYDLEEHGAPIQKSDDRVIALQRKSELLQEENAKLKNEAGLLRDETDDLEEQEASLVSSCVGQLQELQLQLLVQEEDLATKNEVLVRQQEEVTSLMQANIHLTGKNNKLVVENAELQQHLDATKSTQRELVMELKELEERYAELSALYQEAQDEIKALRRKQKPLATPSQLSSYSPFLPADSLAMELQDSIRKDTSPEPASQRKCNSKRVMDTVRCVRGATSRSGHQTSSAESGESLVVSPTCSSMYMSEGESMISDDFDLGAAEQISSTPLPTKLGRPGIPGSNDLETALRRLSLRKANEINDKIFQDVQSRKTHSDDRITEDGSDSCRSPDSYMSTGSGGSNLSALSSRSSQAYRRPQKLQIIKPLEGSLTLYQWQRLATPHLGGVLESRPGIQIKGQEPLALPQPQYYSLSDVEEDDDETDFHVNGRCGEQTCGTYTYTTARVTFPTSLTHSNTTLTVSTPVRPVTMTTQLCNTASSSGINRASTSQNGVNSMFGATGPCAMGFAVSPVAVRSQKSMPNVSCINSASTCRMTASVSSSVMANGHVLAVTTLSALPPAALSLARSATVQTALTLARTATHHKADTTSFMTLTDKVKHMGVTSLGQLTAHTGLQGASSVDPVDVGLNTIMGLKRRIPTVSQSQNTSGKPSTVSEVKSVIHRAPVQDCKQS